MPVRQRLMRAAAMLLPLGLSAGWAQQPAPAFGGVYRMDCQPIGPVVPGWQQQCEAQQAKGGLILKFSQNPAGVWQMAPAGSVTASGQTLEPVVMEGHRCLQAPMLLVCEVPPQTDVFNGKTAPGQSVQSRSGRVLLATNLGAIDLIKVAEQ
jgi:hypothetical protein